MPVPQPVLKLLNNRPIQSSTRFLNLINPDFAKYGESFGLKCSIINKVEEVIPILKRAMEADGPSLIEFKMSLELNTSTTSISELHGI